MHYTQDVIFIFAYRDGAVATDARVILEENANTL
jgi:hypothetical protein